MTELVQILEKTFSQDSNDQRVALELLQQASEWNFPDYLCQLSAVLSAQENTPFVRKAAGLQLKNALVAKEQSLFDKNKTRWTCLTPEIRGYVKNCILQTLGTELRPSTAAQCIAAIACIELPTNQWPELIERLNTNVMGAASSALLKESSLEALGYVAQDMSEKQRVGPVLAAIVEGMRSAGTSVHVQLAATRALSEIVDWVVTRTLDEYVDAIVDLTSTYLQTDELNLYEEAAKCLWKIASRKCVKTAETSIVVSMFRDEPMNRILTAASVAAEVSSSSVEHYKYLKALCDLLCALGLHLAEVWSYVMKTPPNFALYISALSAFFMHPSIYIRAETAQVIAVFFGHERISKNVDFLKAAPALIQFLAKAMNKSLSLDNGMDLTSQYSAMDYDVELESQREYIRLRDFCLKIIRESTADHFDKLMVVTRDWIGTRCVGTTATTVSLDEWDVMKRFINAVLQSSFALDLATNEILGQYLAFFDAVLQCSVTISSGACCTPEQQRFLNGVLSILSALFPIFDHFPERIPVVLEHFKALLMLENDPSKRVEHLEITATKRHTIALLLKMVSSFSTPLKPYARNVLDLVATVSHRVSMMQRANLVHVLAALSNLAGTAEEQAAFLGTAIAADIKYIEGEPFSASPADFLAQTGLTTLPNPMAVASQQCPFYQSRLTLKASLTALEGVLSQVNVPPSEDGSAKIFELFRPVVHKFFRFCKCLNSIYMSEYSALIHPSYGPSILEMSTSERQTIASSLMNIEPMDAEMNAKKMEDYESGSQSASNGGTSIADSIVFMRRFIGEVSDLVQSIVGLVCARFCRNFYAIPDAQKAIEETLFSVHCVPNFRIRFWIRRAWGRIITSCPEAHSAVVLPLLKQVTGHMQQRLVEQWEALKRKQSQEEDVEPAEEEMIEASMMSLLSRECATFTSLFVLGDSYSPKNAKREPTVTPIAEAIWKDREAFLSTLGLLAKLITCPDSQAVLKCIPVLNLVIHRYQRSIDEHTAVPLLVHAIQSLQMYINEELAAGPILTLIFNIYAHLRPLHPNLLEVLKQIPNCVPENIEQFDQRIMGISQQAEEETKLHDKIKRDLMRKVLVSTKCKIRRRPNSADGVEME